MVLYRIAKQAYIRDLSGLGASIAGGRWNPCGVPVVYTAESRALAILEYLVHVPLTLLPPDLYIAEFRLPDDAPLEEVAPPMLPEDWRGYPAPAELAELGAEWVKAARTLLLRVPSVLVEEEHNVLLNPAHPAMADVELAAVKPFRSWGRFLIS